MELENYWSSVPCFSKWYGDKIMEKWMCSKFFVWCQISYLDVLEEKKEQQIGFGSKKVKMESPLKNISTMDHIGCLYNLQFAANPATITHAYVLHLLIWLHHAFILLQTAPTIVNKSIHLSFGVTPHLWKINQNVTMHA